jgi:hypothetical protein
MLLVCALLIVVAVSCSSHLNEAQSSESAASEEQKTLQAQSASSAHSGIKAVDFANQTYRARPIYKQDNGTFNLVDGRYEGKFDPTTDQKYPVSLSFLAYGDVTGDGSDEAMVVLFENVKGTALPYFVYIFTAERTSPRLLWAFETGDRADGGLRRVFSEAGNLVVEQYFNPANIRSSCPACPTHFTRTTYRWRSRGFEIIKKEVLANPAANSPAYPIMEPYRR